MKIGQIEYLGKCLEVKSATLAGDEQGVRSLVVIGEPVCVRSLGSGTCYPYVENNGLDLEALLAGGEIAWKDDVAWANRTYFTMHGEGFGLFSGWLKAQRVFVAGASIKGVSLGKLNFRLPRNHFSGRRGWPVPYVSSVCRCLLPPHGSG